MGWPHLLGLLGQQALVDEPGAGDKGGVLAIGVDFGVQGQHDLVGQLRVELAEGLVTRCVTSKSEVMTSVRL